MSSLCYWPYALIGTGVALGALVVAQHGGIYSRLDFIDARLVRVESELSNLGQRVAYVADSLDGQQRETEANER